MKRFVLALALIAGHASADVPEIVAKKVTCEELKAELVKYKSITVVKSFLGIKKRLTVEVKADCDSDDTNESAYFKTKDVKYCEVGEYCKAPGFFSGDWGGSGSSYDSGYSSGSSYDSGYSSGSSYSGSSSSGSSGSSGSSHGSSYNPPSSSSTGSNYNPPSSGTRGPRYCPSCAL